MGYHVYPQEPGSPSARSDTDLWNHINRWIWGKSGAASSPRGNWGAGESSAIVPTLERYGQVHQDFHLKLQGLGDVAQGAKAHRDEIERKLTSHSHPGSGLLGGLGAGLGSTAVIAVVVIGGYFYLTSKGRKKILRKARRK